MLSRSARSASITHTSARSQRKIATSRSTARSIERRRISRPQQPWDDTLTDLGRYKLTSAMDLARKMNRISKHKDTAAVIVRDRLEAMNRDVRPFLAAKKEPQQPTSCFASKVSTGRQPPKKSKSSDHNDFRERTAPSLHDLSTCMAELDYLPHEDSFACEPAIDMSWVNVGEVEDDISRLQAALTNLRQCPTGKYGYDDVLDSSLSASTTSNIKNAPVYPSKRDRNPSPLAEDTANYQSVGAVPQTRRTVASCSSENRGLQRRPDEQVKEPRASTPSFGLTHEDHQRSVSTDGVRSPKIPLPTFRAQQSSPREAQFLPVCRSARDALLRSVCVYDELKMTDKENVRPPISKGTREYRMPLSDLVDRQAEDLRRMM